MLSVLFQFCFQPYDLFGVFARFPLESFYILLGIFQLDLGSDKLMLEIVKLLFLILNLFLKKINLLFCLILIVRDIELE